MRFYNRESELEQLEKLDRQAERSAIMTALTGRRRIGKTELALHLCKDKPFLYLFVGRKSEALLCQEYVNDIKQVFDVPVIGQITTFKEIFMLLLEISKKQKFTLIIDEFQDFYKVSPAVFSELQKLWDINKSQCKIHVIFSGSVYSLMHKIFEDKKEPLFGRADQIINLKTFHINTLKTILDDYKIYSQGNLFDFYLFTGGIPKYLDILFKHEVKNKDDILNVFFSTDSLFINEGKNLLIEEFGKSYTTYFSILELISRGKTSRSEIQSILQKDVGGFLENLEKDYSVIQTVKPINARPQSKTQKYKVIDNFLNFWFKFIYTNQGAVEMENFTYLKSIVKQSYSNYSGRILENFFRKLLAETKEFNQIGSYWEKGNLNEIDIIAINQQDKSILVGETKLNKAKISINSLKQKSKPLLEKYKNYDIRYESLSITDIDRFLNNDYTQSG